MLSLLLVLLTGTLILALQRGCHWRAELHKYSPHDYKEIDAYYRIGEVKDRWTSGAILTACVELIGLFFFMFVLAEVVNGYTIPQQIAIYEQDNAKIENQLLSLIYAAQTYEAGFYTEFKSENAVAADSVCPELRSVELVEQYIEAYKDNQTKVRDLRISQAKGSTWKWWLYFGR